MRTENVFGVDTLPSEDIVIIDFQMAQIATAGHDVAWVAPR